MKIIRPVQKFYARESLKRVLNLHTDGKNIWLEFDPEKECIRIGYKKEKDDILYKEFSLDEFDSVYPYIVSIKSNVYNYKEELK